jgi:hypothetical protein
MLNPWGAGLFRYVLTIQSNPVIQSSIMEWFPPTLRDPQGTPFLLALLACAALFALSSRSLDPTDVVLFVVFAGLGLQAMRNSIWFGIVAAPLAAAQIVEIGSRWRERWAARPGAGAHRGRRTEVTGRGEAVANSAFAVALLALACLTLPWVKPHLALPAYWQGIVDGDTPVAAVQHVAERYPEERFFHSDIYGSYMIWATPQRPRVFIDCRIELYPVAVWTDYVQISLAQGWEERLAKYGIRHVLLAKNPQKSFQQPLLGALQRSPDWTAAYEDERSVIFVKRGGAGDARS